MTYRTTTTAGRSPVHIEVARADELPRGAPGPRPIERPPEERGKPFRAGSPSTVEAARAGGRARRFHTALASCLGYKTKDKTWARCKRDAEAAKRTCLAQIAATVGRGQCITPVQIRAASSALFDSASRLALAAGDFKLAVRLAQSARQDMLCAFELAARDAEARERAGDDDPLDERRAAFQRRLLELQAGGATSGPPAEAKPLRSATSASAPAAPTKPMPVGRRVSALLDAEEPDDDERTDPE